jgi:tetratricopeptide (TPR) repeat protein
MSENGTYFELGQHHRAVTTNSESAQTWFDRGLTWVYGYNHEEALVCFQSALEEDPNCAMAQWGIAYAIGPNYNKAWEVFEPAEKEAALRTAHQALDTGLAVADLTAAERALLEALRHRYPTDPTIEDFSPFDDAFGDAMRPVHEAHPDDLDVCSLFAEALMGRTPWQLWDLASGQPADGASTEEARSVLETAFQDHPASWSHPGMLHMYIHLMEMSPTPELALPHGDQLVTLVPDSGHLVHMATHIDVLCGEYQNTVARNHQAAIVDRSFASLRGADNFYTLYRIHNVHFEAYGAMLLGQQQVALEAAAGLQEMLPPDIVGFLPDLFEAFWGIKVHAMVRFGMWDELLEEPLPEDPELFSFTTALLRYGRTVALANLERIDEARAELESLFAAQAAVQETRSMFNNPASEVLKIAAQMAQGELHYKAGDVDVGLDHLRQAAELSDGLAYDEPWGWMQPPRHALGALLMEQHRFEEAEQLYRADLGLTDELYRPCQHPGNVWALHGLSECLEGRGERLESRHVGRQLAQVLARADVEIGSSCFCRTE